ncbi:MAG TPA: DNA polymerase ligase N-terminal domain-containing protein [Solirubrobacteraceae bacterium]|nr:DNA polymerase ligase N-terminal domain-containing protein [Solirubrobacteraceae bacterium]
MPDLTASRISVTGLVSDVSVRDDVRSVAMRLGLLGWVRLEADGMLCLHAEGERDAVAQLVATLPSIGGVDSVSERQVRVEGHEQFAIRGVPAGVFVVQEHQATAHHFDVRLEVDGVMRSWAVPKGPSMDPTVKRFAVQVEDHTLEHNHFEAAAGKGGVIIWDRGQYEQGGRVPWPEALERGHAVFVLHGEKLHGGFALQRTSDGEKPQWLLIKRKDDYAARGSDIVAERPESVHSGLTLAELIGGSSRPPSSRARRSVPRRRRSGA